MFVKTVLSEDGSRRSYRGGFLFALTTLVLMAGSSAQEAEAKTIVPLRSVASDTIPVTAPRLFERRVLFSPQYLTRAVEEARAAAEAASAEAALEKQAETYARKYRISKQLALQIIESAIDEGLDPDLGFRLVRVESVFKPNARGPGGSLGLTQLMPSTARSIDRSLRTDAQILDPETNLRTGFRYLREMIERYDGNVRLGVLAYNRGEVAVDRAIRAGRDPENGYSPKVLRLNGDVYSGKGLLERKDGD